VRAHIVAFDHHCARRAVLWRRPALTRFLRGVSLMGEGKTWFAVCLGLSALNRIGWLQVPGLVGFLNASLAALAAWVISSLVKKLVRRGRPFQALSDVPTLYASPLNDSFPSSHTAASFALFFALLATQHPLAWPVGAWAACVAFSRVYLGVHFVSDIFGGLVAAVLGASIFLAFS